MNGEVRSTPDIALSGLGEQEGGSGSQQLGGLWSCVRENDPKVRCKIYVTRFQRNWEDPYLLLPLANPFTATGCPWPCTYDLWASVFQSVKWDLSSTHLKVLSQGLNELVCVNF